MALLIPLLLPHVVQATTNIGIGISNAIQGNSSSVSFQIGNKVYTTAKGFHLPELPYELRRKILLMSLTESKSLILPTPYTFDPTRPMSQEEFLEFQKRNPLHPDSDNYRSIVGDRVSANGYPISSWRWRSVCSEWNEILMEQLWNDCDLSGPRSYSRFMRLMDGEKFTALPKIRTLTFQDGFSSPADLYQIMANPALQKLESISILPNYPTPYHPLMSPMPPFPFGLQLIPSRNTLKSLTYGLPLEITTNEASRQHLANLKVPDLGLTFVQPSVGIFEELKDLVSKTTGVFRMRYVSVRTLTDCSVLLCEPLQSFEKIELSLNLPRTRKILSPTTKTIIDDPESPTVLYVQRLLSLLEALDEEVQKRYTVYMVKDWEAPSMSHTAKKERIWPKALDDEIMDELINGNGKVKGKEKEKEPSKNNDRSWERQTDLRLFGGLIGLRMESSKR